MSDAKYGRLFTERDVALLVGVAYSVGWRDGARFVEQGFGASRAPTGRDELLAHVLERTARDHALTFPPDEPLFLLRAQDKAAPNALATETEAEQEYGGYGDYWSVSFAAGAEEEHLDAIRAAADRMREWQQAHPDRVKAPD